MLLCPSWIEETDVHQDFPKQCFCCPNMETLHHFALRRSFFAVELPSGCTRFVCTVCNGDLLMSSCFIVLTRSKSKCSFVSFLTSKDSELWLEVEIPIGGNTFCWTAARFIWIRFGFGILSCLATDHGWPTKYAAKLDQGFVTVLCFHSREGRIFIWHGHSHGRSQSEKVSQATKDCISKVQSKNLILDVVLI